MTHKAHIVFLHGWGQSAQVWYQQRQAFPHAHYLNLPGHGGAPESSDWLESLAQQLPTSPSILIAWSLGGMLAMQLAIAYPERIKALVLVASTPHFVQTKGWPFGCSEEVLQGFESGIKRHPQKTMARFFSMVLHGSTLNHAQSKLISEYAINQAYPPTASTLQFGLQQLAELDLRSQLPLIKQPCCVIHGENDAIIPYSAGNYLAEQLPGAKLHHLESCGHAPFLSHSKEFNQLLESWCHTI